MKTAFALAALAGYAAAECPNACSGHGTCGQYDMCTCQRNWKANDCSERVCPFGISFVTSPQGDLNMDGDRYDNTHKLLVKQTGGLANQGSMQENDDVLTLNKAIQTGELVAGDAITISDEMFVVSSVQSTTKFTLDHDRFTAISTEDNVYRFLETQASPEGTWETWVGDYNGDDEGHYYMECSNRGICDTKEGVCECFAGYSGAACQRQSCPNDCSGHGTCETITELAAQNSTMLATSVFSANPTSNIVQTEDRIGQLAGTVYGTAGSTTLTGVGTSFQTELDTDDEIIVDGNKFTVTAIASAVSLTLGAVLPNTILQTKT